MKRLINKIGKLSVLIPLIFYLQTSEIKASSFEKDSTDTRYVVVIDQGHGWENKEPGVMDWGDATYKEYKEADIVFKQGLTIKELADSTKYKIILTRDDNKTSMPIEERQKLAKEVGANLFISLHLNNYRKSYVRGFEVIYRQPECRKLAKLTVKNLEENLNTRNRGIKRREKLVLKNPACPSILIESGFLKNYNDRKYILDNIPNIEQAILATIDDYFKSNPVNPFPSRIKSRTNFQIPINYNH